MAYTGREDNEVDQGVKRAGKAALDKLANSKAGKAVKLFLLKAALVVVAVFVPFLVAGIALRGLLDMARAVKEGFVKNVWNGFANIALYDEPRLQSWNDGGDPDLTALIYQQMVSANNAGEPEYLSVNGSNAVIDALSENSAWRDLMRNEHVLLSQEDMTYILMRAYDYNNEMFRMKRVFYGYDGWKFREIPPPVGMSAPPTYVVEKEVQTTETSSDKEDNNGNPLYDNLTREHIEGEEDEHGDKRFAFHWQDAFALASFYNIENNDNWGTSDENTYDYKKSGIYDTEPLEINSTDGFYITDADLRMVCDLFEFNFTYYWDEIADLEHDTELTAYKYDRLLTGDYTAGYRFRRIPDPAPEDNLGPFASKDLYKRSNQDLTNPYEYRSYNDHLEYDETTLPFTQFTPESCPNTIKGTIESYKYVYTPIYSVDTVSGGAVPAGQASLVHLDKAGTTDYVPDPDDFSVPNGDYCVGRWRVVDPRDFVDTMAILCPWYKSRSLGDDGKQWIENSGYDWVKEMMDYFCMYLEYLPWGSSEYSKRHREYYKHIAELYSNKEIEVYYDGTNYEDKDKFYEDLKHRLLEPVNDIYVALDIDGTLDKTAIAEPIANEKLRDHAIEAIKWMEGRGMKYVFLTAVEDLDGKRTWVNDNILSKLDSANGYKGTYKVSVNDRYKYCHSHQIDILVDDNPTVISTASKHMPVIEMKCGDWPIQPTGDNIYVINGFDEFKDAMFDAMHGSLPVSKDYHDWKIKFIDHGKDYYYNYQLDPKKYPFYSYGVTYHNRNDEHIGDKSEGEDPFDSDPGDPSLPDVEMEKEGQVYIYQHDGHVVDGWYYILEGADTPLDEGLYTYSETDIATMLGKLEALGGGAIDFTSGAHKVYEWHQSTGADVAAILAIIITEGGNKSYHGVDHWNFYDFTPSSGESIYFGKNGRKWWDAKLDCPTIGDALVGGMNKVLARYWRRENDHQNTFYKMCFNQYGYPQTREEAIARDASPGYWHCYCPWWDDTGYKTTGWDSQYSWANKTAGYRAQLRGAIGAE